jgi:ubiquinone/menaquinone biosynthesis C-methylase UbiE
VQTDPAGQQKRHRQRRLFNSVAELYDSCRSGYPDELLTAMTGIAGLRDGSRVLEVGCGTGQLTRQLAARGFRLLAIDLGPAMIEIARRNVPAGSAEFEVSSFEDYQAASAAFQLIVSATAFHWVDPEIKWAKAARLLAPGGWLAVLSTGEHYDEPLGSTLTQAWIRRGQDGGAWAMTAPPSVAEQMERSGLFGPPVVREHAQRRSMPAGRVLGLELTRATSLSYDEATRASFRAELAALLQNSAEVGLEQRTHLTMAPVSG